MKNKLLGLAMVLAVAIPLFTVNLTNWPVIWFDEGLHLQIPKNLSQRGLYGIQSSESFRPFDPIVSVGPSVTVPIAWVFSRFGVGIFQARIVIVIYALLAIICFFMLSSQLFGTRVAMLASLLLIATPMATDDISSTTLGLSRMMMGELPALFFVLAGSLVWFWALDTGRIVLLLAGGALFGLATLAKPQTGIVLAVLPLIWIVDRLCHRQLRGFQVVVPLAVGSVCAMLWFGCQAHMAGLSDPGRATVVELVRAQAIAGFASGHLILKSLRVLLASGSILWGLPGLVYGLHWGTQPTLIGLKRFFMWSISLVWLAWFVLASIGWLRYAFVGLAIMNIFAAKLLVDLAGEFLGAPLSLVRKQTRQHSYITLIRGSAVMIVPTLIILTPIQQWTKEILAAQDTSVYQLAQYLDLHVPKDRVIESFEPELAFLTDHRYHQPSLVVMISAVQHVQLGRPYPPGFYDFSQYQPAYVILGNFGKQTEIYGRQLFESSYQLIVTIGNYDLYRVDETASR